MDGKHYPFAEAVVVLAILADGQARIDKVFFGIPVLQGGFCKCIPGGGRKTKLKLPDDIFAESPFQEIAQPDGLTLFRFEQGI